MIRLFVAIPALCLLFLSIARADEPMIEEIAVGELPFRMVLNDGNVSTRYRFEKNSDGTTKFNGVQYKALFDVSLFFFKDHVELNIGTETSNAFEGDYNNSGIGTGDFQRDFNIRRLALSLSPMTGLKVTMGSMGAVYGAGSDNTFVDSDGYIMGYRAKVAVEKGELVVTGGYLGDLKDPNVFNRLHRMDMADFNFLQAVFTRSIGDLVKASIEFDQYQNESHVRGAMKLDVSKWVSFVDSVTVEDMVRISSDHSADVFAAKLSKKFKDILAGRDLAVDLSYIYRTKDIALPIGDKVWEGQSFRAKFEVPNLLDTGVGKIGWFADFIQSFSDFDRFRIEVGLKLTF